MSRDRGTAEPVRLALLGLLLDGPSHGYDLARRFAPGTALGDIVHLGASHLYALLGRLERDGLIAGEQQEAGARPQRRVFALTASGRTAAEEWMHAPVAHPRDMRIEFPLKLYLLNGADPAAAAHVVRLQREVFERYIERLEGMPNRGASPEDARFIALMQEGRTGRARAALEWLESYTATFAG